MSLSAGQTPSSDSLWFACTSNSSWSICISTCRCIGRHLRRILSLLLDFFDRRSSSRRPLSLHRPRTDITDVICRRTKTLLVANQGEVGDSRGRVQWRRLVWIFKFKPRRKIPLVIIVGRHDEDSASTRSGCGVDWIGVRLTLTCKGDEVDDRLTKRPEISLTSTMEW
jgi:hypothetical protein